MKPLPTYRDHPSWTRYRALIATHFGLTLAREPEERWEDWRGHRLHLDVWRPQGPPLGTVVLVHGGGGHGRLLAPLGDAIAGMGWQAIAPDLPGYGLTQTAPGWRPDYADWVTLVADLLRRAGADGPAVTYGLSLGGLTALWAAQEAGAQGVVASTLIDPRRPGVFAAVARTRLLGWLSLAGFRLMPWLLDRLWLPLTSVTPLAAMSAVPEVQVYFRTDPLLGRRLVPVRFFRTTQQYRPARADFRLAGPLLLLHPGADLWTPVAMSRPVFDAVPGEKSLVLLENGSHLPFEAPGYQTGLAALGQFLARVRAGAPSG